MAQPGRGEIECRLAIGERADDAGSPPDLAQNAFERIVGSDAPPVLLRKIIIGQRLLDCRCHKLGRIGQA